MNRTHWCVLAMLVSLANSPAYATDASIGFVYSHRATDADVTFHTILKADEAFTVTIKDTCPSQFEYLMHGVVNAPPQPASAAPTVPQLTSTDVSARYDSQFGSYLLDISKKPNAVPCYEWVDSSGHAVAPPVAAIHDRDAKIDGGSWKEVTDLREHEIVIAVTALEWEVGQDAALTIVPWSIRKWTTAPVPTSSTTNGVTTNGTKYQVKRDSGGEDWARINFATLTHLYPPRHDYGVALGFGLVDNSPEYYMGMSWGFGPRTRRVLNFALGAVLTPMSQLPVGISENDLLDNASTLTGGTFRTTHQFRFFAAFTATFFRSGSTSEKPVAPPE